MFDHCLQIYNYYLNRQCSVRQISFSQGLRLFFPWMGRKEWLFLRATNIHYDYEKDYIDSGTDVHDGSELQCAVLAGTGVPYDGPV